VIIHNVFGLDAPPQNLLRESRHISFYFADTPTVAPATTTIPPVPSFVLLQNNKPCLKAAFRAQFTVGYESRKTNSVGINCT
jgi:hypothetical protein